MSSQLGQSLEAGFDEVNDKSLMFKMKPEQNGKILIVFDQEDFRTHLELIFARGSPMLCHKLPMLGIAN
jgi:hypothetical protein